MTLSLFSLAGIPPFAGFFSKFFIFMAAFDAGFHLLVFIALVNTVISLYYYLLIVKAMYITPSDNPIPTFRSDRCTKWGLALCTLVSSDWVLQVSYINPSINCRSEFKRTTPFTKERSWFHVSINRHQNQDRFFYIKAAFINEEGRYSPALLPLYRAQFISSVTITPGIVNQNLDPFPFSESTPIRPPNCSTML